MKYNIITIEREFASGGMEIAKLVAERLNLPCYGREILEMAARKTGTTVEQVRDFEETATNSLLYSIAAMSRTMTAGQPGMSFQNSINIVEAGIIEDIANRENCVILGRGASYLLRERQDVMRVFIRADLNLRILRAIDEYHVDSQKTESIVKKTDKRRANYYKALSGTHWSDISRYHLILDSGKLGIQKCVEILCGAVMG